MAARTLVSPLVWVAAIAGSTALFGFMQHHAFGWGRVNFFGFLAAAALVLAARPIGGAVARRAGALDAGVVRAITLLAAAALALVVAQRCVEFAWILGSDEARDAMNDIGANTYAAARLLLDGRNPYDGPAQLKHVIEPGPHATVGPEGTAFYGVPYPYGYPYWPAMVLWYAPFAAVVPTWHAIRWGNAVMLALAGLGVALLARKVTAPPLRDLATVLAPLAFVLVEQFTSVTLFEAPTDGVIGLFAVWGWLLVAMRRHAGAGALLGVAFACKLLPGPLLLLPALVWTWRNDGPGATRWLLGAWATTSAALVVPFVLWNPAHFLSSTLLFYAAHHAGGDDTALYYFLPESVRAPFSATGALLALAVAAAPVRDRDLAGPIARVFGAYLIFVAFNRMGHLNYVEGVWALGSVGLVAGLLAPSRTGHEEGLERADTRQSGISI